MATTTKELTLKFDHQNGDTSSLKFGNISDAGMYTLKAGVKAINTGKITIDNEEKTVNYQPYLLSKAGSPATRISAASLTETTTDRVYVQGQE